MRSNKTKSRLNVNMTVKNSGTPATLFEWDKMVVEGGTKRLLKHLGSGGQSLWMLSLVAVESG